MVDHWLRVFPCLPGTWLKGEKCSSCENLILRLPAKQSRRKKPRHELDSLNNYLTELLPPLLADASSCGRPVPTPTLINAHLCKQRSDTSSSQSWPPLTSRMMLSRAQLPSRSVPEPRLTLPNRSLWSVAVDCGSLSLSIAVACRNGMATPIS